MSNTILFLSNCMQVSQEVMAVRDECGCRVVLLKSEDQLEVILPRIQHISPGAIVAFPITAKKISSKVGVPVIPLCPNTLDFIEAFEAAKRYSTRISYVGYSHPTLLEDLDRIEKFLGITVDTFVYEEPSQREAVLTGIPAQNTRLAVVTSHFVKRAIERRGGRAIVISTSRSAVLHALRTAIQVINSKEEEARKTEWLARLLDLVTDGVIGTDTEGNITVLNRRASLYLGIVPKEVIGKNIGSLKDGHPVKALLGSNEESPSERLCIYKDRHFLVNKSLTNSNQVILTFRDESEIKRLQTAIRREAVNRGMVAKFTFDDIVCKSRQMRSTIELAKKYARSTMPILITGETGVGKEVFAQSIHNHSQRRSGPFVAINCATIPEPLLESELFGYEGGSFTGARREGKKGLFELAHGGTLFLDEIGEMPLTLQARLLRVLQDGEIRRLGGDRIIPVDVRILAATNQDLRRSIKEKTFREDLYYRIHILNLFIPPLRERIDDIPELIRQFLADKAAKYAKSPPPIDDKLLRIAMKYHWPGNVRELESFIEKCVFVYENDNDEMYHQLINELATRISRTPQRLDESADQVVVSVGTLENMEKQIIIRLLRYHNVTGLSRILGISRTTLWRKLKEYGLNTEQPVH